MSIKVLGFFNTLINDTATAVIDSEIVGKSGDVLKTVVDSSIGLVGKGLVKVQDATAPDVEPEPEPLPEPEPAP